MPADFKSSIPRPNPCRRVHTFPSLPCPAQHAPTSSIPLFYSIDGGTKVWTLLNLDLTLYHFPPYIFHRPLLLFPVDCRPLLKTDGLPAFCLSPWRGQIPPFSHLQYTKLSELSLAYALSIINFETVDIDRNPWYAFTSEWLPSLQVNPDRWKHRKQRCYGLPYTNQSLHACTKSCYN